jgi:hypothetical protein
MKKGRREIIIQDIDESSFVLNSSESIEKYLKDHFYDACNINNQLY